MEKVRLYPTWEQISAFKNPLTEGEMYLVRFLDKNLPDQWEIYVQPHLNGDRPDVVILNPKVGVQIFEVKDWQLQKYYFIEDTFFDTHNRQTKKQRKYYVRDTKDERNIPNPVNQVVRYRQNLINYYLPQIGDSIDDASYKLAAFKIALYFHNAETKAAQEFVYVPEKNCIVFGRDSLLDCDHLSGIIPDVLRETSKAMTDNWANEIRFWLNPPFHSLEQGTALSLSPEQERHAISAPTKHQRLRGVAGSGKTLVIAQRAANLASQGKKVLIITFNITLWHYIKDHVSRARYNFRWDKVEFNHFHGFCRNFLSENDIRWPLNEDYSQEELLNDIVPRIISETVKSGRNTKNRQYDAILIDEGQDFEQSYYDVLCQFLTDNDEVLLVVDERQNIYDRKISWIDTMRGTKFRGRWRELKESRRLPPAVLKQASRFAELFLPKIGLTPEPSIEQTNMFQSHLIWRNINRFKSAKEKIWTAVNWLNQKNNIHPQDIVVLVPSHREGLELVELFDQKNMKVNHVFEDENRQSIHNKKAFWMGDGRLKICTIHSFKGWEILNVIVLTPTSSGKNDASIDFLLHIAITRTRQNLIVFNQNEKYEDYGKEWPKNWSNP